jgi:hypothetical protein
MWIWIALLLGLLTKAQAEPTVSVSLGVTRGNTQPSGIWWQKEYPRTYDSSAPSFTLRVDNPVADGWSVGVGYAFIGNFHSDALAQGSDPAYAAKAPYPLSRWIGSQKQDGMFVVARKTWGNWYAEAGPMLTRTSFSMTVLGAVPCVEDVPRTCLIPDYSGIKDLYVGTPRQMKVEFVGGVGYQVSKNTSVQFNVYPTRIVKPAPEDVGAGFGGAQVDSGPGILKGYSGNLSLGWTFK